MRLELTKVNLQRWFAPFDQIFVYPMVDYDDFCNQLLNQCHILACSFPFCGSNSTFDAMHLGVPLVAMDREITIDATHDANLIRWLKLPEWLIAKDDREYVNAHLRLIDNPTERINIGQQCRELITEHVKQIETGKQTAYLVDSINYIYQHHARLSASRDVIWYRDIATNLPQLSGTY